MVDIDKLRECGVSFDEEEVWIEEGKDEIRVVTHSPLSLGRHSLEELIKEENFVSIHYDSDMNSVHIVYKK